MYLQEHLPSSTLTVRLKTKVKDDLDRLCESTRRTRSFLAAEAIEAYVAQEIAIIRGIQKGLRDMKAGRTVSHETAMNRVDAAIEKAAKARK